MPAIPTPDRLLRLARDQAETGVRLARQQAETGVRLARQQAETGLRLARQQAGPGVRLARGQAETGVRLARDQAEALTVLPGALVSLTRAVTGLDATIRDARDTVARLQRIGERLDGILDEVEQPVKDLAPGLRRAGAVLDDPAVSDLPDTVRRIREDLLPLVATLRGGTDVLDRLAGARSLLGGLRGPRLPADPPVTPPVIDG